MNTERHVIGERGNHFLNRVEGDIGANISACYQCERCTNGCPVSIFMDIKPHQVIRYVQMGRRDELLKSSTIWVCLSCETCTTYCPNEVGVAEVINHLRNIAASSSVEPAERPLAVFHRTFLEELQRFGRVNEFWMINSFNLKPGILKAKWKSGVLKEEMLLGMRLFKKGRLHLLPSKSKGIKRIRKIMKQNKGILDR